MVGQLDRARPGTQLRGCDGAALRRPGPGRRAPRLRQPHRAARVALRGLVTRSAKRLTTNLTTTSADNLPFRPTSHVEPCQVSHGTRCRSRPRLATSHNDHYRPSCDEFTPRRSRTLDGRLPAEFEKHRPAAHVVAVAPPISHETDEAKTTAFLGQVVPRTQHGHLMRACIVNLYANR